MLRGFFLAFFQLHMDEWGGFLSGLPGLPGNEHHDEWHKRLMFCLKVVTKLPPKVAQAMVAYTFDFSLKYGTNFARSVATPLFDTSDGAVPRQFKDLEAFMNGVYTLGDIAAKR